MEELNAKIGDHFFYFNLESEELATYFNKNFHLSTVAKNDTPDMVISI